VVPLDEPSWLAVGGEREDLSTVPAGVCEGAREGCPHPSTTDSGEELVSGRQRRPKFTLVVRLLAVDVLRHPRYHPLGWLGHHEGEASQSLTVELSNQPRVRNTNSGYVGRKRTARLHHSGDVIVARAEVIAALEQLDAAPKIIHDLD
jgi:hypothetical protein